MFATDVLREDFKDALSKIDFEKEYDPYNTVFMKALFLGEMWNVVKTLESDDDVDDELEGARKYWRMFLETSDIQYKEMALDELRHAGILIKKKLAHATDAKKKSWLDALEKERQEMLKAVSSKME